MARKLEWLFSLIDRVSGPAVRAARAVDQVTDSLSKASKASKGAEDGGSGFGSKLTGLAKGAKGFFAAIHPVIDVLNIVGEKLMVVGQAVAGFVMDTGQIALEAVSFKENTMVALEVLLGSKQAAASMYAEAIDFAAKTPFETKDIIGAYQNLLTGGFKTVEIPIVMQAVGDLGALHGFDQQVIDTVIRSINQIKAKGKLQGEEVMQLAEAGVPMIRIQEELGRLYNKNTTEIQKMMSAGQISSDSGIFAVVEAIRKTASGGGAVGTLMMKQSETFTGLISTLKGRAFELLQDLGDAPGLKAMKQSMLEVVTATDQQSAAGKRLKSVIESVVGQGFQAIFGRLGAGGGTDAIEQITDLIANIGPMIVTVIGVTLDLGRGFLGAFLPAMQSLGQFMDMFGGTGSLVEQVGRGFGYLGVAIVYIIGVIVGAFGLIVGLVGLIIDGWSLIGGFGQEIFLSLFESAMVFGRKLLNLFISIIESIVKAVTAVPDAFMKAGSALFGSFGKIGTALADAFGAVPSAFYDAGMALGGQTEKGTKDALAIRSPSRKFMEIGAYTYQGFVRGAERESDSSQGTMAAVFSPAGGEASPATGAAQGQATAGNGVTVIVKVELPVVIQSSGTVDAQSIMGRLRELAEEQLGEVFENLAAQLGRA